MELIENNENLINLFFNKENGEFSYRLIFKNKKELYQVKDSLNNLPDIISIKLDLN